METSFKTLGQACRLRRDFWNVR